MANKVTPWEVEGDVDYDRLIRDFGLEPFDELPDELEQFLLYRRGIVYAHRDIERVLKAKRAGEPFAMMTGLMPSGKFHFGHKLVADQILAYQKLGAKIYIAVADIEAYNARGTALDEQQRTAVEEYLTNYVALGLDLESVDFYFQSARSTDGKKSNAYYRLAGQLARHATFNEFRGVYGEITPGKMASSLLQASDMYHPQLPEYEDSSLPTVIPVGTDQDPHIRLARDMAGRIPGHSFTPISATYHQFLPGLKGGKMSSSDETSYIALTDSPEEAERKIKKYAFSGGQPSLEEHKEKGGDPDVDVSYQMLRFGLEESDEKLAKIRESYEAGEMLTGELKQLAIDKLRDFLEQHAEKRKAAKKDVSAYLESNGY